MTRAPTQIYRRIAKVPGAIWDAAAQGELGFDRRLLAAVESPDDNRFRYIVHEAHGATTIATATEFRDSQTDNPFANLLLGRANHLLPVLRRALGSMLILQTRFARTCAIMPRSGDDGVAANQLNGFFDALECYAAGEGLAIVLLDVAVNDDAVTRVLETRGYLHSIGRPIARLHVNWSTWDGYLQTAKQASRNAYSAIRREVNRAEKRRLVVSEWDSTVTDEGSLRRLYEAHHGRMNRLPLKYPEFFFTNIRENIGSGIRVLVAHRDQELVGSTFLLIGNDRAVLPLVGIDHAKDKGALTYFNLTYYAPIRLATEEGLKTITFGVGAYEAKIRRGCRAELSRVFWRPSGWAGRRIYRCITAAHRSVYRHKFRRELSARAFSILGR